MQAFPLICRPSVFCHNSLYVFLCVFLLWIPGEGWLKYMHYVSDSDKPSWLMNWTRCRRFWPRFYSLAALSAFLGSNPSPYERPYISNKDPLDIVLFKNSATSDSHTCAGGISSLRTARHRERLSTSGSSSTKPFCFFPSSHTPLSSEDSSQPPTASLNAAASRRAGGDKAAVTEFKPQLLLHGTLDTGERGFHLQGCKSAKLHTWCCSLELILTEQKKKDIFPLIPRAIIPST